MNIESLRSKMAFELFKILEKEKLTQVEAAKILGIKQPDLSKLKSGNFYNFSLERIINLIHKLNGKVQIKVSHNGEHRDN